ncbi:transcriptional regulator [Microbacterium sp. CGR1]|uniref:LacI family DNA-binding transcriptional regulator n=1 Tax=Microbacterium sp. CGR1 TaxID=1696072 RepID=UPI00069FFB0C|nr:LacI family DNA-binding transcriptional regulator [Microbacterium sp. CGR1]AKV86535.1 transcriptional regulator [Microbacterium sp. CGR1]
MTAQSLLPRARHEHLLRQLELHGSVSAAQVADELGVAQVTIRRDILELEKSGLLARVHGGAIGVSAAPTPQSARTDIGVVVPSSVGHFPVIVKGMDAASHALRVRLILATSQYRPDLERRQVERLVDIGVDGIILAPTLRGRTEAELLEWVGTIPVPVVFLERRLRSTGLAAFDSARTDHAGGAVLAVEHLAALGHARVALALFERTPTAPLVREGYASAVADLGLEPAPQVSLPKDDEDDLDDALTDLLDRCVSTGTRAALVHTDVHAARLVEMAMDLGIRVPENLAVIAYDDDSAALALVPLTAVTAPGRDLGQQALRTLMDRIAEDDAERSAPRHLMMGPGLTVRSSCGAAR